MWKHKLLYEILAALIIIGVGIFRFDFIVGYINGAHELDWAYDGFTDTNMSLRLLFLFGVTGYGIYWMIWNFAKRSRMPVMIGSILIATVAMAYSLIFYYIIPISVIIAIAIIKIKQIRRKNGEGSSDGIEGIHRDDTVSQPD